MRTHTIQPTTNHINLALVLRGAARLLVLIFTLFVASAVCSAKDFYVAQSQAGTTSGADCGNARPSTWFNSSSNWGSGGAQIAPGDTVHICGTINGALGATAFKFQASGTNGNPITLLFEPGAVLTSPAWSHDGAIDLNGKSFVTVNGDINNGWQGLIQNTANGTNLANHSGSIGVACSARNCTNAVIENLRIYNIYIHTGSGSEIDQTSVNAVTCWPCDNLNINHVQTHDAGWAFNIHGNNAQLQFSEAYNIDHGVAGGPDGAMSGMTIHDNHIHDYANWDTSANSYHHDGIHLWGQTGGSITSCSIYNNRFDGNPGVNTTGHIFLEEKIQNCDIYNNVFVNTSSNTINCLWLQGYATSNGATNQRIFNNFINCGPSNGNNADAVDINSQSNFTFKNNIVMHGWELIYVDGGSTPAPGGIDYNVYQDLLADGSGSNAFSWKGNNTASFATWKSNCGCDSHSVMNSLSNLLVNPSTGQLLTGSIASNMGINLTALGIQNLNSDIVRAPRPTSGPWAVGAYTSGTVTNQPAPPSGLTITRIQ